MCNVFIVNSLCIWSGIKTKLKLRISKILFRYLDFLICWKVTKLEKRIIKNIYYERQKIFDNIFVNCVLLGNREKKFKEKIIRFDVSD